MYTFPAFKHNIVKALMYSIYIYYYYSLALQPNAGLRLHIPLSLDCSYQFPILHFFFCPTIYNPSWALHRLNPFHQTFPKPHFWFPNGQFCTEWGCQPHAQSPTWRTRSHICNPWAWLAQLYPQALGTHFSHLLRDDRLQWDYSLIPVTRRDTVFLPTGKFQNPCGIANWRRLSIKISITEKSWDT